MFKQWVIWLELNKQASELLYVCLNVLCFSFFLFAAMTYVDILINQTTVVVPECTEGCVNGQCVPPGLCACTRGWVGANCTTGMYVCSITSCAIHVYRSFDCYNYIASNECVQYSLSSERTSLHSQK